MSDSHPHSLEDEIEAFRESLLKVYQFQPTRLQRDASSAKEVSRDHVGRWPYELLQNAEDAKATAVAIIFTEDTIYFADNGVGLPAGAVESLCGTHFSEKPATSIGRKGLGFKAVYCVSPTPAVFSGADGLVFDREWAVRWMQKNNLETKYVPYQWLPFLASRAVEEKHDAALAELSHFRTVVRLSQVESGKISDARELMQAFNSRILLTSRSLRHLEFRDCDSCGYIVEIKPDGDGGHLRVSDSRLEDPIIWKTCESRPTVPKKLLATFDEGDDRERAESVGVRVAAPLDQGSIVVPLDEYPHLHVYYPTDEQSPVRMLLHGDFLIKSDRTALVPLGDTKYNQWVASQLAALLVEFVIGCYTQESPTAYLRLLRPSGDMRPTETDTLLWEFIVDAAMKSLLIPGADGVPKHKPAEAIQLELSGGKATARQILEVSPARSILVHDSLDEDPDARKVLAALNVKSLEDQDIVDCIRDGVPAHHDDQDWLWACWEWLAEWSANDETREKIALALPIIPGSDGPLSGADAQDLFVTWVDTDADHDFPDWLPLRYVPDWFRDRLHDALEESPVRKLAKTFNIVEPSANIAVRALARAAKEYSEEESGEPDRFLRLLLEKRWFETEAPLDDLRFCPVPARKGKSTKIHWVPAQDAYFGKEWGEETLEKLFQGNREVYWVVPATDLVDEDTLRSVYQWLGILACPWVIRNESANAIKEEKQRVNRLLPPHTWIDVIPKPTTLEHVDPAYIANKQITLLLSILAKHWQAYYEHESVLDISYRYRGLYYAKVPALWWEQILTELRPPLKGFKRNQAALGECWLATKKLGELSQLLPCIDLSNLPESEQKQVIGWLRNTVELRNSPEQLNDEELKDIIEHRIPALVPESACGDQKKRDRVSRWYTNLLQAVDDRDETIPDLSECPLLCKQGDKWKYVDDDDAWLNDDTDAAAAFSDEIATISFRSSLHKIAIEMLGLKSLAESKEIDFHWKTASPESDDTIAQSRIHRMLEDIKPFIFAWVAHNRTAEDSVNLQEMIASLQLNLVHELTARIRLDGVEGSREIPRAHAFEEGKLILDKKNAGEGSMAKALADAVNRRKDADFYELLLLCPTDDARSRKLIDDGNVPQAELDKYLAEWVGHVDLDDDIDFEVEPDIPELPDTLGKVSNPQSDASQKTNTTSTSSNTIDPDHPSPFTPPKKRELRLKDTTDFSAVQVALAENGRGGGGVLGAGVADGYDNIQLSQEQRNSVEDKARKFVAQELVKLGYEIEQMPRDNPGFDIRAKKPKTPILFIEVKGHLSITTIIDLTAREYAEYLRCLSIDGEHWELWNVQNLSADREGDVLYSRHDAVPEEALGGGRTFRVNLRHCQLSKTEND